MPVDGRRVHAAHNQLAQLVGETLIHAHPWLAEITAETAGRHRDKFLEDLEAHATQLVSPLLDTLAERTDLPPEVAKLVAAAKDPTAQFGSLIQQFFVYGLMFQLAGTALAPFTQQMSNNIWSSAPDRPLPPPDIATGVVRGIQPGTVADVPIPDWAAAAAAESGYDAEAMQYLADVTGAPPDATSLFEMVRRGIIDEDQLAQGMRESDLRDSWIASFVKLRYVTPTPVDLVRSAVQNQISYDQAAQLAGELGLEPAGYINNNPDWFQLYYNTYGRPPGPVEMGRAANRGLTDWDSTGPQSVSFHQAIAESDIKDKYIDLLKKLAVYYPSSGEVRTLLLHGGITEAQALDLWAANGVPPDIAQAYLHLATIEQVTQERAIAKGDILELVKAQAISDDQAATMLGQIGYSDGNAQELILLAKQSWELEVLRRSTARIGELYTGFKLSDAAARSAFTDLGLEAEQVDALMARLAAEKAAETPIPSAAQIASGLYYGILNEEQALDYLGQLGYPPWTAWFLLSVRMHAPLPNPPPQPAEL